MKPMIALLFLNLAACTHTPVSITNLNEQGKSTVTPTPLPALSSPEGRRIMTDRFALLNDLLNKTGYEFAESKDDKTIKDKFGPTNEQRKREQQRLSRPCIYKVTFENSRFRVNIVGCQKGPKLGYLTFEANARDLNPGGIGIRDYSIVVPCNEASKNCVSISGPGGNLALQFMKIKPHNLFEGDFDPEKSQRFWQSELEEIKVAFSQAIQIAQR
jgi:hypothetical protein